VITHELMSGERSVVAFEVGRLHAFDFQAPSSRCGLLLARWPWMGSLRSVAARTSLL
jgi:hypothetical protein